MFGIGRKGVASHTDGDTDVGDLRRIAAKWSVDLRCRRARNHCRGRHASSVRGGHRQRNVVLRVRDSCPDNDVDCVGAALKRLNQKPEVATTYADLGGAFLIGLYRTYGNFGVGVSVDPWKANSNSSIVVVGGIPTVQFVADSAGTIFGVLGAGYEPLRRSIRSSAVMQGVSATSGMTLATMDITD